MSGTHFLDSTDVASDGAELLARVRRDGYVFVRGALPADAVRAVRTEIVDIVRSHGWLANGATVEMPLADMTRACVDPEPRFFEVYKAIYALEALHRLPHHPRLLGLLERILGEPVLVHPRLIGRAVFPVVDGAADFTTPAHQDFPYMQGAEETLTTWIPLGDCPLELGPLTIAEGSHTEGVREVGLAYGTGGTEVLDALPGRWRTHAFAAGDVVLFHSLSVHKGTPNRTSCLRLSVDCRYQRRSEAVTVNCLEMNGPDLGWNDVYAGWKAEDLKFYWRDLALEIVPFDGSFLAERDALALAGGERGDRRAISVLQRIAAQDMDAARRARAAELVRRLSGDVSFTREGR